MANETLKRIIREKKRRYNFKNRIPFGRLETKKNIILAYKKAYGHQSAINFAEGLIGLRRGEFMKNRKRIKDFIKKL